MQVSIKHKVQLKVELHLGYMYLILNQHIEQSLPSAVNDCMESVLRI